MVNPFRPSWGEPYVSIAARMRAVMADAAEEASGHEAVLVSHQLAIWVARRSAEDRRLWHHPARRECALASVTSFTYREDAIVGISYAEPAGPRLTGATEPEQPWGRPASSPPGQHLFRPCSGSAGAGPMSRARSRVRHNRARHYRL